jgi:hypothetical protein
MPLGSVRPQKQEPSCVANNACLERQLRPRASIRCGSSPPPPTRPFELQRSPFQSRRDAISHSRGASSKSAFFIPLGRGRRRVHQTGADRVACAFALPSLPDSQETRDNSETPTVSMHFHYRHQVVHRWPFEQPDGGRQYESARYGLFSQSLCCTTRSRTSNQVPPS